MWANAQPGFTLDSTSLVAKTSWRPLDVRVFDPNQRETRDDITFELLGLRSPNNTYTLDVDSYQVIEPDGDTLEVGGEPDSRCSLIDNRSMRDATLEVCGTTCAFNWGAWLSDSTFAIGGWRDADDAGQRKQGCVMVYSIPDSTVAEYRSRIVTGDDLARYLSAWNRWLLARYRTLKPKRMA